MNTKSSTFSLTIKHEEFSITSIKNSHFSTKKKKLPLYHKKNGHLVLIQNTNLERIRQLVIMEFHKSLKKTSKFTKIDS
jgi:hypothetical protein